MKASPFLITLCVLATHWIAISGVLCLPLVGHSACPVTLTYTPNDTICRGTLVTITAADTALGGSFIWTGDSLPTPVAGATLTYTPHDSGIYRLKVVYTTAGCTDSTIARLFVPYISTGVSPGGITQPSCGKSNGSLQFYVQSNLSKFSTTVLKNGAVVQNGSSLIFNNAGPGSYRVFTTELTTGCSSDTSSAIILTDVSGVHPTFDAIVITPVKCFGDKSGAITLTIGNCGGGCTYKWSHDATNKTTTATNLAAGLYTFSVSNGVCSNLDTIIMVTAIPPLRDSLIRSSDFCGKSNGSLHTLVSGGTHPYTYTWTDGSHLDSLTGLTAGTTASITVTDSLGCTVTTSATIVTDTSGIKLKISPPDTICSTDHTGIASVTATGVGPFSYLWSSGSTQRFLAQLPVGTYTVTVSTASGCTATATTQVLAYDSSLHIQGDHTIYVGQTDILTIHTTLPITLLTWSPHLPSSTGATTLYVSPADTTTYYATLHYGSCVARDSFTIYVRHDSSLLIAPNVFTPNGDGQNDYFYVEQKGAIKSMQIFVFDRWGGKVYQSSDVDFKWDGTNIFAGNNSLPMGVYVYVIEYETYSSTDRHTIDGNISLIR